MESPSSTINVHRKNGVLVFPYQLDHTVRIGDHITCSCREDWSCDFLKNTVQRLWDTNRDFPRDFLVYTSRMPPIRCPICFEDYKYLSRGSDLSICGTCLRVSCVECVMKLSSSQCPICQSGELEKFTVWLICFYIYILINNTSVCG
jgi:hypothetical protein